MKDTSRKKLFVFADVESKNKIEKRIQIVQQQTGLSQGMIIESILYSALSPNSVKGQMWDTIYKSCILPLEEEKDTV